MRKVKILAFAVIAALGLCMNTACTSDQEITQGDADETLVTSAREYLSGEIVLSTKADMSGVDKTLLPNGCPTKFQFKWSETEEQAFNISLLDFTVGNMGMIINFKCDVKTMQLNSWEQKEYTGNGWIKFYGTDGSCWGTDEDGSEFEGDGENSTIVKGSFVQGYYNAQTHQIQFVVNYNMMNVRSDCFMQTIDKSRLANFDAEKAKYEEDLQKYKEEHGL